ncbi:dephospho-CoA kinase [Algibacter amylolyticus]|uniref:Dephospho-CoA kinase n=1 Tax=Algibacter amylolyticus TaxID=1608400 RepID=A0A5M7B8Q7_9FLAO|nr:dephospho-CoA kinase [Algibacter amylolyticus]KAA5824728.1 dephospho-CoA kinase [Algibacter amylolyticus]MBB5268841.1 dephospho-CoA kinase [Algibacter amylolyticus]TSJ75893.1 dephospho-CoA kinase [Algibacter amylolyticus]
MIVVGLTGGIGSGKTTVAKEFAKLGVPIYIADNEAKALMRRSKVIKRKLIALFGEEVYVDGQLNKPFIANIIFNDKSYLQKMNAIVHPRVGKHFQKWALKQEAPYVIKEVAILFENGGDKACDYVITVTAPIKIRVERLLKRDDTSKEKIEAIMKNQWTDEEKIKHSHFVIENTNLEETLNQVLQIHKKLLIKQ